MEQSLKTNENLQNKVEYHQLFLSKIPDMIEGHRAYNALIDATLKIDDDESRINTSLERRKFNNEEIKLFSELYQWHKAELKKMGIDELDHIPLTEEDKKYIDQFLKKIPWYKRFWRKLISKNRS